MPPVAMTWMPAKRQAASVAPTVVAPSAPSTMQAARSRGLTLRASEPAAAIRSSCSSSRPTWSAPSMTATVAGTAPPSRTRCSHSRPTASPSPGGKPCATIVVSRATIACIPVMASWISGEYVTTWDVTALLPPSRRSALPPPGRARSRPRDSRLPVRPRRRSGRRPQPAARHAPPGARLARRQRRWPRT